MLRTIYFTDGSQAGDSPLFALNDGVTAFAQDVQFTNNTVTCARFGECVFVAGGTGLVVSDNQFQATDPFSGVHLQANGPDPTVFLPIRIDGAQVLRNTIVATTPSLGLRFGGIRVFDAGNILIADNVISVEHTCTGRTTKMTTRSNVPAFRQTIFNATSRISPTPSGRRCGTSVTPIRSFQAWQRA